MAALTKDRDAKTKELTRKISLRVEGGVKIYNGAMVCVNAAGYAVPAANTAGLSSVVGVADELADNTTGADGAIRVVVRKGTFGMKNGTSPVVQASTGTAVFVEDDQTVGVTTSQSIRAGTVDDFSDDGLVYVKINEHVV
jgi:hypothetical protein